MTDGFDLVNQFIIKLMWLKFSTQVSEHTCSLIFTVISDQITSTKPLLIPSKEREIPGWYSFRILNGTKEQKSNA
jgi:hypothetical protein